MSYSWPIFVTQFRDYVQQYPQLTRVAILPSLTGNSGYVLTVNAGQTDVAWTAAGSGGIGTVTSVSLTMPSIFGVSGSPITTSGTITSTLSSQNANIVFAGPTTGAAATPTFRALVAADIPNMGANPTASVGLSAVNGSAATFLRSDGAPALSQSIAPTWAGVHIFNAGNLTLQDTTTTGKQLIFASNSSTALTANHTLTIDVMNSDRTIKLTGNTTLNQDVSTAGVPVFTGMFSSGMDGFNPFGTLPTVGLATTSSAGILIMAKFSNDATGPLFTQMKSRGVTVGSGVVVQSGDPIGGFNGYGYDSSGYTRGGAVFILAQGTISAGIVPGTVQLRAANSSGTLTTMVDANGNSGVVTLGGVLKLNNAYVATPPTCSGYVTVQDSSGTTYKILVST